MVYRNTVVLLHPCCVWGHFWWHLLYQTQNSLIIVSIVIYSSHWSWNLADVQAVIDSCVFPLFSPKMCLKSTNNGATHTDRRLTHPKHENLKKELALLNVQYALTSSIPKGKNAIYVHIKCKITPGPDKEKLSHW